MKKGKKITVGIISVVIAGLTLIVYLAIEFIVPEIQEKRNLNNLEEIARSEGITSEEDGEISVIRTNSEKDIPYNTDQLVIEVNSNEIKVLTGGPVEVGNFILPGGTGPDRGSVVVFLPENNFTTSYHIESLIPGKNWLGTYKVGSINMPNIEYIISDRVKL